MERINLTIDETMFKLYRDSYLNASKAIIATDPNFNNYLFLKEKLDELIWVSDAINYPVKILSGLEQGENAYAVRYADENKLTKILFPVNRDEGKLAEKFRYDDMLTIATHLIVFTDGKSEDLNYLIKHAREKQIPIYSFQYTKNHE